MRKLTKEQKRDIRAIAAKRDRDIDFSDAPPVPILSTQESASLQLLSRSQPAAQCPSLALLPTRPNTEPSSPCCGDKRAYRKSDVSKFLCEGDAQLPPAKAFHVCIGQRIQESRP